MRKHTEATTLYIIDSGLVGIDSGLVGTDSGLGTLAEKLII